MIIIIIEYLTASPLLPFFFFRFYFAALATGHRIANRMASPTSHFFVSLGADQQHAGNTKPPGKQRSALLSHATWQADSMNLNVTDPLPGLLFDSFLDSSGVYRSLIEFTFLR
ncbi:hypothetical protein BDV34DRAFT_123599 [Aspergillus parasiticus]|uniref:Uncharacterized protein n=1 Tax=Aspergillus parasiticus TaxID=5067 RepID=A0A5N6E121_ASPPA|nr:hypothetical protein BDV34DRAFT_123599 [Aspergillus parasiticus]